MEATPLIVSDEFR